MPQLQAVGLPVQRPDRGHSLRVELVGTVGISSEGQQFLLRIVRQIQSHNLCRPGLIPSIHQAPQKRLTDLGDGLRRQQSAIPAQPHFDGLRRVHAKGFVPRTVIFHLCFLTFRKIII